MILSKSASVPNDFLYANQEHPVAEEGKKNWG